MTYHSTCHHRSYRLTCDEFDELWEGRRSRPAVWQTDPRRRPMPEQNVDPRIAEFERERADAIEIAHKAMTSSYIGAPPPGLRGDADRMVAALLKAGWTPPSEPVTEHAEQYTSGAMLVRNSALEVERVYPLEQWVPDQQQHGGRIFKRRVIVVDDWTEVPRG